ncbi:MAG: LemA family protein [Prevotellaceae bacterium]|nr:LemA family protein [Prevotellaceae bacterium]
MKKIKYIALLAFVATGLPSCSLYNKPVAMQEKVEAAWAQVQNQYQRRADLIPNLVETVKGYAKHEEGTLQGVVEARARATQVVVSPDRLDEASLQRFQAAQSEVGSALGRLMAIAESYPDLKANQNFMELQAQLEGTENRIAVERRSFNEVVREYNTYIRRFPNNLFAGMFGFEKKSYFEAEAGADKAPAVKF